MSILTTIRHPVHRDARGYVAELLRAEDGADGPFGQITVTTVEPGISKGNHYHTRKVEWFCVLLGAVELVARDRAANETETMSLTSQEDGRILTVRVPPNTTHAVTNHGDVTAYVLLYASEPFDPTDPDTYAEPVRLG